MKRGFLSEYFNGVAAKRLSAVEALAHRSNQHEFDGVAALKSVLGPAVPRRSFRARLMYLNDQDDSSVVADGFLTWYDAREKDPKRSECRLYFPTTPVSAKADEGDLLIVARRPDDSILVVIARRRSTVEGQLRWLFGIGDLSTEYLFKGENEADRIQLRLASKVVLEQIGVEIEDREEGYLAEMVRIFGGVFPSTREFSAFARTTLREISANDDPDTAVAAWVEREEALFRTLERHLIADRLKKGFDEDVDAFIDFSLSVQNRRKSRAGSSLELHLEHLFAQRKIRFSRGSITEGRSRPDFVFPGEKEYRAKEFPAASLTMLGVKSSCKERWRQILAEANRIEEKHLFTLEPSISENQTVEMKTQKVQLVIPASIHETYSAQQRGWLMKLADFMKLVEGRQT